MIIVYLTYLSFQMFLDGKWVWGSIASLMLAVSLLIQRSDAVQEEELHGHLIAIDEKLQETAGSLDVDR